MFYVISQVLFRFPGIYRLFLNCKIKIHPYFCVSGIYFYKTKIMPTVDFTFTNAHCNINEVLSSLKLMVTLAFKPDNCVTCFVF